MDQATTDNELQQDSLAHQHCFIAHSHKAPWRKTIINVCQDVLPRFGLTPWYADEHFDTTIPLREKVVDMVARTPYGIYDLSFWESQQGKWEMPRNVFIELGMAIALNRPTLLLRHAKNRLHNCALPLCLQSISDQICEFAGGQKTLRTILAARLPQWLHRAPEQEWRNRFCIFGGFVCSYREVHPQTQQWKQTKLHCHISDGNDIDRVDFRDTIESVLERLNNAAFTYLDGCSLPLGYTFLLCSHCQLVRSSPFAIYRITPDTTADTFIAIGMSIALEHLNGYKIPKILLTTNSTHIPSLLSGYEVVTVRDDSEMKRRLQQLLPQVIQQVRHTTWKPQMLPFEISLPSAIIPVEPAQPLSEASRETVVGDNGNEEEELDPLEIIRRERNTQYDFLISFVESDRDWARWIAWTLHKEGCDVLQVSLGMEIRQNFWPSSQFRSTNHTIILLSPDYLQAIEQYPGRDEFLTIERNPSRMLLPIRVKKCDPRQLITDRTIIDFTKLGEALASRRLQLFAHSITSDPKHPKIDRSSVAMPAPPFPGDARRQDEKIVHVFISYAREDEAHMNRLCSHLQLLQKQGLITIRSDKDIPAGDIWQEEINRQLNKANIILLLVSADYLVSDHIYNYEMQLAISQLGQGAIVIPIILRPCLWQGALFGDIQPLPTNAKPITTWENTDQAFLNVAQGIRQVVEELRENL